MCLPEDRGICQNSHRRRLCRVYVDKHLQVERRNSISRIKGRGQTSCLESTLHKRHIYIPSGSLHPTFTFVLKRERRVIFNSVKYEDTKKKVNV